MLIRLVAVGTRMPQWVEAGIADYSRRLGPELRLEIRELPATKRGANEHPARAIADEGRRILLALDADDYVVALDVKGKSMASEPFAQWLGERLSDGRAVVFVIGGADGLAEECLKRANLRLSLSALTLPHALVRVVIAEQVYRAMSILKGHPYHRA